MTAPASPTWIPSTDDVGAVIARLVPDQTGLALGEFTDQTVPTAEQVLDVIDAVTAEVALAVGVDPLPAQAVPVARRVVALGAGARIAVAFFPEVPAEYANRLEAQYESTLARLLDGLSKLAGGSGTDPDGTAGPATPVGYYPPVLIEGSVAYFRGYTSSPWAEQWEIHGRPLPWT